MEKKTHNRKQSVVKKFIEKHLSLKSNIDIRLDDIDFTETFESLPGLSGSRKLFLGRFNEDELLEMMTKTGLTDHLNNLGFDKLLIDLDKDQNQIYYFRLYWREIKAEMLLIDLRLSETTFIPDKKFLPNAEEPHIYEMIVIEWLSAKNPMKQFDITRPQLPGQTSPGLGVMRFCFDLLYLMAKQVYKDGFLDIPDHMHGAMIYSKKFKFFDPVHEGILRAVMRDLSAYTLSDISWGVITSTIIERYKNEPAKYEPGEQIFYVSKRMKKYFNSKRYQSTFKKYYNRKRYYFDYEEMKKRREEILKTRRIEDL